MKRGDIIAFSGMILMFLGMASMDSPNLVIPFLLIIIGLLFLLIGAWIGGNLN